MKIKRVKINNYRNLDGIELCFDKESNYIVGENNLGKSTFCLCWRQYFLVGNLTMTILGI